jgi:hypothetical protein
MTYNTDCFEFVLNRRLSKRVVGILALAAYWLGAPPNIGWTAPVAEPTKEREVQVTIVLRGAASERDIPALIKALRSAKGVKVITEDFGLGFRRFNNRFTTPIVVTFPKVPGDDDANIGALASAVAKAETASRDEYPPGVNLILFTDDQLKETSISALRSSLSKVNGVEVDAAGGLGASIQEGWCWVRLENAGGAMLLDIEKNAGKSGTTLRRLKEASSE